MNPSSDNDYTIYGFFIVGKIASLINIRYLLKDVKFQDRSNGNWTRFYFISQADANKAVAILNNNGISVEKELL